MHEDMTEPNDKGGSKKIGCETINSSSGKKEYIELLLLDASKSNYVKTMENEKWYDEITGIRMGDNCTLRLHDYDDGRGSCERSGGYIGSLHTGGGKSRWCNRSYHDAIDWLEVTWK